MRPGAEERREKDRPIDPTSGKKFARKRARSGVEPRQADGRQPFMPQEYLTTPVFELIPSVLPCEADAAAFVGRAHERLSSSDGSLWSGCDFFVKNLHLEAFRKICRG
jgi:hypothetical protein